MSDEFSVDLDGLDELTAKLRGYQAFMTDSLQILTQRVESMLATSWSGLVADAFAESHRDWLTGVAAVREGMKDLETAAATAHASYRGARDLNKKMFGTA